MISVHLVRPADASAPFVFGICGKVIPEFSGLYAFTFCVLPVFEMMMEECPGLPPSQDKHERWCPACVAILNASRVAGVNP